ncbi:MAG: hypothetical protein AAF483_27175 [Planctomycetota bacterium]
MDAELNQEQINLLNHFHEVDRRTLKALFTYYEPPELTSLEGEYDAELLSQGSPFMDRIVKRAFGLQGKWLGKAFRAEDQQRGYGYNCFLEGNQVLPRLYMDIRIEPSEWTDGLSMKIDYCSRNRGIIRWLEGEVREATSGLLLGFGSFGPKFGKGQFRRRIPFVMYGPVRPFQLAKVA